MLAVHILLASCLATLSWSVTGESGKHVCSSTGEPICKNGGTCIPTFADDYWHHHCLCTVDWTGSTCEIRDLCQNTICEHGGTCVPGPNGAEVCSCTNGYHGKTCGEQCGLSCKNGGTCIRPAGGTAVSDFCDCKPGYGGETCQYESQCIAVSQNGSGNGDKFTCFLATPKRPSRFQDARASCADLGEGWTFACPRNAAEHATAIIAKRNMEKALGLRHNAAWFGYRGTKESLKSKDASSFRCFSDDTSLAARNKHYTTWHPRLGGGGPAKWKSFPTWKNSCVYGTIAGLFPDTCRIGKKNKPKSVAICSRSYNTGNGDAMPRVVSYDEAIESYQRSEDIDSPVVPFWDIEEELGEDKGGGLVGPLSMATVVVGAALLSTFLVATVLIHRRRRLMGSALLAEKGAGRVDEEAAE